jgi:hypothetical protein
MSFASPKKKIFFIYLWSDYMGKQKKKPCYWVSIAAQAAYADHDHGVSTDDQPESRGVPSIWRSETSRCLPLPEKKALESRGESSNVTSKGMGAKGKGS